MKLSLPTILIAAASLSGCFPYATTYVHLDVENIERKHEICRQYGAPAMASFESNGVRSEFNLNPSKATYDKVAGFTITAAQNVVLSMPDDRVRVTIEGRAEPVIARIVSTSAKRSANVQLIAERARPGNQRYRFDLMDLPPLSSRGTLELPAIYADGIALQVPTLTFERRGFVGILPLNC